MLDRVPDYLPFVVRTSPLRFLAWVGGLTLAAYLAYGGLLAGAVLLVARDTADGAAASAVAGLLVIIGFLLGIPALLVQRRYLGRGPLMAASVEGICARPAQRAAPAVWLPWDRIQSVYVARRWYGEVVHIVAADGDFTLPLRIADHSAGEILFALRALAATVSWAQPR